jgi:Uma2 family endonuclease
MANIGLFDGKRVELIEGEIFEMSPQLSRHAALVGVVSDVLEEAFGQGYCARTQVPLDVGEISDPEPDVAIVTGEHKDYMDTHPTTAHLIVEISDSTLSLDRNHKASLYAKAGIADYWIVNLVDRQLEVHRIPAADASKPYGFGYQDVTILKETHSVSPLAAPQATIAVADLLP